MRQLLLHVIYDARPNDFLRYFVNTPFFVRSAGEFAQGAFFVQGLLRYLVVQQLSSSPSLLQPVTSRGPAAGFFPFEADASMLEQPADGAIQFGGGLVTAEKIAEFPAGGAIRANLKGGQDAGGGGVADIRRGMGGSWSGHSRVLFFRLCLSKPSWTVSGLHLPGPAVPCSAKMRFSSAAFHWA